MNSNRTSLKAARFSESVIREMTRLAAKHNAINLAQGFPNFPAPDFLKEAAVEAIRNDINQYAITWGSANLRAAVAEKYRRIFDWSIDPETELTVCCGSTECMIASILATVDPGQNVLIFEPFYENYGPDCIIAGASPVFIKLDPEKKWSFDPEGLEKTIIKYRDKGGIRAMILNSPNNPTGKVFNREELTFLAKMAIDYDFLVFTDEIYEHIIYDSCTHIPIATLPGMRERTVTISAISKTFSATGWRIGYIIAPLEITSAIRKMHDFLTVGAAAPLQEAAAQALRVADSYYQELSANYREKREQLLNILKEAGFRTWCPSGAYYIMTDISDLTDETDLDFVRRMIREVGVAAVPGSSFYFNPAEGSRQIRFTFCKTADLLDEARKRLKRLRSL